MIKLNLAVKLPPMLSGAELLSALEVLPDYDASIINQDAATRMIALSDLYKLYIPFQMSVEIYSKLYLALHRSMQKKTTRAATQQQNENHKAILQQECNGILGGSDSFTIIGTSGIGKSSAINRAIDLISSGGVIEIKEPYTKIIPCIVVQCPFDSSVKGLLLEILRKVDEVIGSNYYKNALKIRVTTDMLIGSVSQVAINHVGLLVVDEIQNVVNSKNGRNLIGMLTQLINNSGISICMVGTPESSRFFEQVMQLARRSLGLEYGAVEYNSYFYAFCRTLFSYRYVRYESVLTDANVAWLYEHSAGIISVVVSLVHDAQEIAILSGKEILNLDTLNEAYQKRLSLLHGYIKPAIPKKNYSATQARNVPATRENAEITMNPHLIMELVSRSKDEQLDMVSLLKEHFAIEEVRI